MRLEDLKVRHSARSEAFYISFSDLLLLLSSFFVMLLSMSKIEIGSYERLRAEFTGSTHDTLVELANELKTVVEGVPGVPGVSVHLANDGVRLDLDTATLFNSGSAALKADALTPITPLLQKILSTKYVIDVEGHTDDVSLFRRRGDEVETNWSLSGRRAASVIVHMLNMGFDQARLRVVGYASTRPKESIENKVKEELESARSINRRVSLLIH